MMSDMKEFDVVRVARSDGADTGPGYWPVTTPAILNQKKTTKDAGQEKTPRTKPQMIRLAEDDPRFVEWKVKLGILLKQELSPTPDEGNAWLVNFPRGYWLYEKSKHLWVSGYPIKGKLFKSPQEFALHLIWLLTASMSYRDCCCVHCNAPAPIKPSLSVDDGAAVTHEQKAERALPKVTPVPLPPIPGQPQLKQQTPVPIPSPVQSISQVPVSNKPASAAIAPQTQTPVQPPQIQPRPPQLQHQHLQQQPAQPQHQSQPQAQPLPHSQAQVQPQIKAEAQPQALTQPQRQNPPLHQQQLQQTMQVPPPAQTQAQPTPQTNAWSLKSPILFRTGELVWYQNGSTWRLGMIAGMNAVSNTGGFTFELMPIGHGLVPQKNITKTINDLRPFYAFTVPPVTRPDLKDLVFDEIPWDALFQSATNDNSSREMIVLDASKMAASKIDYSFSLWTQFSDEQNSKTVAYYGCFFGAERFELGDALRVKSSPLEPDIKADRLVLGLRFIFTARETPGIVYFRGHIYQSVVGNMDLPNAVPDEMLPVALREESNWRNTINPHQRWRWVLVKENIVLKEQSIKGRYYPTHRLMPIMNPTGFQDAMASGRADQQFAHLNNRMDGAGRYIGRKRNRLDSLGHAVPHNAMFAFEQHVREEAFDQTMTE